jgi:hypothetical protein
MASAKLTPLHRQVARVHRRLFLQTLLNFLTWCWAGAILLSAGWFVAQPHLLTQPPQWLRWVVAGGALGAGTVLAVVFAILRAPPKLTAALSLDSAFGLKERVTTSLTLAPEQETSPAGQALLADVAQRINGLDVGSRFPVRMSWTALVVPACACVLGLVAVLYQPTQSQATTANRDPSTQLLANAANIEQKMRDLKKQVREQKPGEKVKSEELERLEAELERIANMPRDTKEQVRELVKEMTSLEEQMKNREKEMAERARALQNQLKRLDQMSQKDGDGPAKDLQKALSEGKFDKAKDEIERLKERVKKQELSQKDKEQLEKQLDELKDKLDRLAQMKDKEQQLKQANLDPETLQRELNALKQESQKLGDLKDLANQLGQCQKALKEGDMDKLSENLSKAADKLKNMEGNDEDLEDLRDQLKRLRDAKDSC